MPRINMMLTKVSCWSSICRFLLKPTEGHSRTSLQVSVAIRYSNRSARDKDKSNILTFARPGFIGVTRRVQNDKRERNRDLWDKAATHNIRWPLFSWYRLCEVSQLWC